MRVFSKRWRRACLVSCVAVAAVALAACGGDEPETGAATSQPTVAALTQPTQPPATAMPEPAATAATGSAPPVEVGLDVGQRAPDFTLTGHRGESITRASLEGRPALLYFYTTW